jgi:hypothetical protein
VTYYHNNDQLRKDPQTYTSYLPVHIGSEVIPDGDSHYSLSVNLDTLSVFEDEASPVTFTVTLDNAPEKAVTIPFTLKGSATANTDFKGTLATQKSFTIAAGETEGSLSMTLVKDNKAEKAEQLTVLLGTPSDGGIVDEAEQSVTIYDVYQGKNTADTYVASAGSKVYGNGGNDKLDGSAGKIILSGGLGNDMLIAGKGDELTGDAGNDTFVFKKGSSSDNPEEVVRITDLAAGDKIDLSAISKTALSLVNGIADDLDGAGLTLAASKMNVYLAYDSTLGDDNLYLVYETSAKGVHTHEAIELVGLNPDEITLGLKSGVLTVS